MGYMENIQTGGESNRLRSQCEACLLIIKHHYPLYGSFYLQSLSCISLACITLTTS